MVTSPTMLAVGAIKALGWIFGTLSPTAKIGTGEFSGRCEAVSIRTDAVPLLQSAAMLRTIEVAPYDPAWPEEFRRIRDSLGAVLEGLCIGVEHVGSTSVPGLAAKPIIDLDVVISTRLLFQAVRHAMHSIGYQHRGNLEHTDSAADT